MARRLNKPPSYVNKSEHADRQVGVLELREWCAALGVDWLVFLKELENHLPPVGEAAKRKVAKGKVLE